MTSKKDASPKKSGVLIYVAKITAIAFLAFFAALSFRQSAGILAMTPLALVLCGAAAFIAVDKYIYLSVFGITVFFINTIEQPSMNITLTYTTLCLLACLLFKIGAWALKKSKKAGIAAVLAALVFLVVLNGIFVGNPFAAIKAKNAISDYTEEKYPSGENAALGEFDFSSIYYSFDSSAYEIKATSSKFPTESGIISYNGNGINDGFQELMTEKICQPYVLEITALLRKYFPDDTFFVSYEEIASKPGDRLLSAKEGELDGRIAFDIYIGGIQTANVMAEKVSQYMQIIDSSNLNYSKISFKSGISPWMQRCVRIDSDRPFGFDSVTMEHVHPETSERFNRFVSRFIKSN